MGRRGLGEGCPRGNNEASHFDGAARPRTSGKKSEKNGQAADVTATEQLGTELPGSADMECAE